MTIVPLKEDLRLAEKVVGGILSNSPKMYFITMPKDRTSVRSNRFTKASIRVKSWACAPDLFIEKIHDAISKEDRIKDNVFVAKSINITPKMFKGRKFYMMEINGWWIAPKDWRRN